MNYLFVNEAKVVITTYSGYAFQMLVPTSDIRIKIGDFKSKLFIFGQRGKGGHHGLLRVYILDVSPYLEYTDLVPKAKEVPAREASCQGSRNYIYAVTYATSSSRQRRLLRPAQGVHFRC